MPTPKPYRDGWRVQMQKNGVKVSQTFRLKRDAVAWINEQEGKKSLHQSNPLSAATAKYIDTVSPTKRDAVKWETARFKELCDHVDPELGRLGDVALNDIDSACLGRWRDHKLKTVTGSTVVRYVNLYRNLFKLAHEEWKWIEAYPFAGVRLPKEEPPRTAIWRAHQIRRILKAGRRTGGKTYEVTQAFHIALRTAMRLQEALAAPACFDKRRKVVDLPPTKTAATGETVPLTREGFRLLQKMPHFQVDPNEASTLFSALCKANLIEGLEFRDSRATALTHMARDMDILTLARISRHKDLDLLRSTYYRETSEDIANRLQPKPKTTITPPQLDRSSWVD